VLSVQTKLETHTKIKIIAQIKTKNISGPMLNNMEQKAFAA